VFVEFALERRQLFRLMVQRIGDNPQILDAAMATTDARLIERLQPRQRVRFTPFKSSFQPKSLTVQPLRWAER